MNRRAFIAGIIGAGLAARLLPEAGMGWRRFVPWEVKAVHVGIAPTSVPASTFVIEGTDHLGRYAKEVIQLSGVYPNSGIETETKWRYIASTSWHPPVTTAAQTAVSVEDSPS